MNCNSVGSQNLYDHVHSPRESMQKGAPEPLYSAAYSVSPRTNCRILPAQIVIRADLPARATPATVNAATANTTIRPDWICEFVELPPERKNESEKGLFTTTGKISLYLQRNFLRNP